MENISQSILKDLEDIYTQAMVKENFGAALKAKELLGREYGLFSSSSSLSKKDKVCIADLSEEELESLIEEIQQRLKLDPS